ncbi:nitrite reductase large subunit NirB [Guyparkeria hydrothermalis]|uniref:nitrite reductase large subunit NirB n=1 Tax=Guyparkeria TaxID=2035712 RepID=UPI0010ABDF9E|nr:MULTISPECIES: nitrite reductase large subunit NirB [Guyparkeria]MCL7750288.1 nitrite reductase large subunit NirB [Guyparkeria hydrothermalis]TKA88735.1 NAD(P)/FAD-dependent oxidoreductase [Guyparkeria sp. SB14A]
MTRSVPSTPETKPRLVLIGNGMAGMRTLEELLKLAPDMYEITVFGDEPYGNYNRIMLSPMLSGEQTLPEIMLNDEDWYAERDITLRKGERVERIDRLRREVLTQDGDRLPYDRVLIATGSRPFIPPIPGADQDGVLGFRTVADVETMVEASDGDDRRAVVIGGGLLGLEAAAGLAAHGMHVTVLHRNGHIMDQQLDTAAGRMLERTLCERGIDVRVNANTRRIEGDGRVTGVELDDGERLPADLVVMATGIRPNIDVAEASKLYCERGIVVDDTLLTYDPKIYAVGECAQHRGDTYGLVAPLFEQAKVCANHLAHYGIAKYGGSMVSTKLKVTGVDVYSAGKIAAGDDETEEEMVFADAARGVYKKLVLRDDRVEGAVLYGDTLDGSWYFQLMREGTNISDMREHLLFGQAHVGDSGHGATARIASLPDDAEICGCNGVCKGDIVRAINENKIFTLDEVRAHTKASASCGSCTGMVEDLMASTLGGDYSAAPSKKPVCECTDHSHDEVREAIYRQELHDIPAVFAALDWRTDNGCAKCRPALNYYLLCAWPDTYQDDPQSRFINERVHANIQKDGTYSVIPRIWGGVTTPNQLKSIAEVAERFEVPTVKITGGQRIDLLGVQKEQLPAMWKDLNDAGFVSGHAYGKSLRTVKTCVGREWCRFGTQDSTGLGIQLEKITWGSWMPHKFKIAVSGCPRNCAEATIKDFGVVCVDSGYELHVGGNGGMKVRPTEFLCKVDTEAEVIDFTTAFIQLYREEARYLERTAPWIERVGLSYVKRRLLEDPSGRETLSERFANSQRFAQRDPWADQVAAEDDHEYEPMMVLS